MFRSVSTVKIELEPVVNQSTMEINPARQRAAELGHYS
jgi:hypothetical protein